jgi:hypothetical protein
MTKRLLPFLVAVCLIVSSSTTSLGWGAGGHMMVSRRMICQVVAAVDWPRVSSG